MISKKLLWWSLPLLLLVLFAGGCFGPGAQFGAPGKTGIKGIVAMPENNCYTYNCVNPQVSEGEPAASASITLWKEDGTAYKTAVANACGQYEIDDVENSCYILYATIQGGEAIVKKGINNLTSGSMNDVGEANYYTTAQVIIYEVAKEKYPDAVKCSDIPGFVPTENLLNAVKKALSECRDAQKDDLVRAYAGDIADTLFGAPCNACAPVTPPARCINLPQPEIISYTLGVSELGKQITFSVTNAASFPQGTTFSWKFDDGAPGSGPSVTHTYSEPGHYSVEVTANHRRACQPVSVVVSVSLAETPAQITVKKVVEGGTTPQGGWSFTVKDSQNQQVTTFTLPENGNYEKTISGLTPGETYTVTETNVLGSGWSTIWQVEGGSSGSGQSASLSAPGTITFTNTYTPAQITVKKVVEGGTTPQGGWSFTVKDSQNQQVTTFTLPENGNYEKTISGLTPGETYTVTETNVLGSGWSTIWQVEGGSSGSGQSASLSAPGTITFTNTYTAGCSWKDETAWADGIRYVQQGNWATYTPYGGVAETVTLWAGQNKNAGTVSFSAPSNGQVEITITLNSGWRFDPGKPENVKIQDYVSAPSGNPNPGGFAHKAYAQNSPFTITVPQKNYYGVHVDVEHCE